MSNKKNKKIVPLKIFDPFIVKKGKEKPSVTSKVNSRISNLIAELEKRDVFTLWLEVRASNVGARTLYESLGFNEATVRRNYYPAKEGREDAIVMALPLG